MSPINAHPEYIASEKRFYEAGTDEEKIKALEEMIKYVPKHKGAETLRKQIKTRYKKLKQKLEKEKQKAKSRGKGGKGVGIRKSDMQAALLGLTNSGKSSLLKSLTNASPIIASYGFTTNEPEIGILNYEHCKIQIIDLPPIGSETFDKSIVNTTDTIIIVIEKIHEISEIKELLEKSKAKQIIVFNKIDLYDEYEKRKISETLKSKRYNFALVSTKTKEGIEDLKEKIFKSFNKIRVYTQQPGKQHDKNPVIMNPGSTVEDVAEKILHGFSKNIKKTKIWGPSSKFGGQQVGMKHVLKDKDIVEFQTK